MAKLEKKRKYELYMKSHFSGRTEKFDRLQGYDHDADEGTEGQEVDNKDTKDKEGLFYSWECVSLVKANNTTLDLVIECGPSLLALIHVVHRHVYQSQDIEFLYLYKMMKFKMKLAYECWIKKIRIGELIQRAIFKTIVDYQCLSAYHLKKFLTDVYQPQHGLFKKAEGSLIISTSNKQKRDILAHDIRLFVKALNDPVTREFIFSQFKNEKFTQMTYGHAMTEYCWFRMRTTKFLYDHFRKFKTL